jgi:4-hydroxy-2-oxoheptanedioate aldolase
VNNTQSAWSTACDDVGQIGLPPDRWRCLNKATAQRFWSLDAGRLFVPNADALRHERRMKGPAMRKNKIKEIWAAGKCATLGWLSVPNTFTAEVMARQGFDALCVDLQHGLSEMKDVAPMLQAISQTDTVPVVRVAWNEPAAIMKALDLGAYGIIVPLVNNAEEAAKAVAACRYPPVGMRSSGPVRAVHYGGPDYVAKANDEIIVMAMIETKEGLENLEAICATPGLDAVYIGPADLSFALGMPPRGDNPDPLHMATCDKIREAAHKAGIKCVMHCAAAPFAAGAVKRGFDMVMLTADLSCMIAGARQQLEELKAKSA